MRLLIPMALVLLACGCCEHASPTVPSPPANSSMVFTGVSPVSGSTIVVPEEYPYITFTVTGFRVYRLRDVTGIRAMLHMRNNGLGIPPTPTETIAEATLPVSFQIRR